MSVHQTEDGRWFVAYREPGIKNPRKKYFGRGPEAKLAATQWDIDRAKSSDAVNRELQRISELTFFEVTQKYLEVHPLAKNTKLSIIYSFNAVVFKLIGRLKISQLSMAHLTALDLELKKREVSITTHNRYKAYIRAICQWAADNDLTPDNPLAKFKANRKKEGHAPALISIEELTSIHKNAAPHLQLAILTMINLGVRPGPTELFNIKISDIDFNRGGVWIQRTKTNNPPELLPIKDEFLNTLKELVKKEPNRAYLIEYNNKPVISLKTAWNATLRRAGITRRLRLYDLRHFYASSMLKAGADLKAVSQLMGHSSTTLTISTYYHVIEEQKKEAIDRLELPNFG